MTSEAEILSRLRRMTLDIGVPADDVAAIEDEDALAKVVDSYGLVELVSFVEREFAIVVHDSDLKTGAFDTLASAARLIDSRLSRLPPPG